MENKKPNKFWEFCKKALKTIFTLGYWIYKEYKKNKAKAEAECHTEEIVECENKKEPE